MGKADLRIDWATHEAAKYACVNWHYSGCLPAGKLVKVGAWENGKFIGVVLFGRGANNNLCKHFQLMPNDVCELVRVALTRHQVSVSRIVAISLRMLSASFPGVRLVVSYADPANGHHGGVYQAGNWIFDGTQSGQTEYIWRGRQHHGRSVISGRGTIKGLPKVKVPGKHRYLMPLDPEIKARILPLAKPYPKRAKQAMTDIQSEQRQGGTDPHAPEVLT
jgi:hypothetical protein